MHGQRILDGNFKPGFRINLHRKDLRLALEAGREAAVPLLATAGVAELMNAVIAQGMGNGEPRPLGPRGAVRPARRAGLR